MYQSVVDRFIDYTVPLEGKISHMYCDTKRLVTVGIGYLIDSVPMAQTLAFRWKDTNKRATAAEIANEWRAIKQRGKEGDGNFTAGWYGKYAKLYLPDAEIYRVALDKLYSNEQTILTYYPGFTRWPAEAQMAVMQMAWLMGPHFPRTWPDLSRSLKKEDFAAAANNCLTNGRPSARNRLDKALFQTAEKVKDMGAVRSTFWYPKEPVAPPKPKVNIDASKVKFGMDNDQVKKLQEKLKSLSYDIATDGSYGPQTRDVVKAYQKKKGLVVDGVAGPITLKSLGFTVT